jgi:hypothetical protein
MALHGRRNHSRKHRIGSARRRLDFECLERRSLLSAVGLRPATPWFENAQASLVSEMHPGRLSLDHAGGGTGAMIAKMVIDGPEESAVISASVGPHSTVATMVAATVRPDMEASTIVSASVGPNFAESSVVSQIAGTTVATTAIVSQTSAPGGAVLTVLSETTGSNAPLASVVRSYVSLQSGAYPELETPSIAAVEVQASGLVLSLNVFDYPAEASKFDPPPAATRPAPPHDNMEYGNSPRVTPAVDVADMEQLSSDVGGYVSNPAPHLPSVSVDIGSRTADSAAAQTSKDGVSALEDGGSTAGRIADQQFGFEESATSRSLSSESNLSASANPSQYQETFLEGVSSDTSTAKATEGGFIAFNDDASAVTRLADIGNASRGDLASFEGGLVVIDTHRAPDQAANWTSAGKSLPPDIHASVPLQAMLQSSLDATEGGAIDLNDAVTTAGMTSEAADANEGSAPQSIAEIRSESGVDLFCDMDVAVGSQSSDESPVPVPIGNASLPVTVQNQGTVREIKPTQDGARRVDTRQRISMGVTDTAPLIAGAVMLVLYNGVELEPAEHEPKRRFPRIKR